MTSPDGITWNLRTTPVDARFIGVSYYNGLFVAIAFSNNQDGVMTSPDGITWTSRTTPDNGWISVAYGNSVYVASSYGYNDLTEFQEFMISSDAITWNVVIPSEEFIFYFSNVVFGNGRFIVFATTSFDEDVGFVLTSTDGENWTRLDIDNFIGQSKLIYNGFMFMALSVSGCIVSTDGIKWFNFSQPINNNSTEWNSLTYGDGTFVSISRDGISDQKAIYLEYK